MDVMAAFPGNLLIRWFRNLPPDYGLSLAHLCLICTAQDMTPLFLEGEAIWNAFQNTLLKEDLPVRMAVQLCSTMATVDFVLRCMVGGVSVSPAVCMPQGADAASTPAAVWGEVALSFKQLQERLCGPEQAAAWLQVALTSNRV